MSADPVHVTFDSFQVGDCVIFSHRFEPLEFEYFSRISGDTNPLHSDEAYAKATEFGGRVVPFHLTLAPLSRVVGMYLPGVPALYLDHEARALAPVYFGDNLAYSARVSSISEGKRILTLSVIAVRGSEVVIEATVRARSRADAWTTATPLHEEIRRPNVSTVLVTGAAGAIGAAVCHRFARLGWNIVAHHRGPSERIAAVIDDCHRMGAARITEVLSDLETQAGIERLVAAAEEHQARFVVHAASPRIGAGVDRLMAVNFEALKSMIDALLPGALLDQRAAFVLVGSGAQLTHPAGWDDYVAAKAASASLLDRVEKKYSRFGVRGLVVAPGFVRTGFSQEFRAVSDACLLPEEVAETVVDVAISVDAASFTLLQPAGMQRGHYGFQPRARHEEMTAAEPARAETVAPAVAVALGSATPDLGRVVRGALRMPESADLDAAALGITAGWDSLRHIELLLAVEQAFRIQLTADDFERTRTFADLTDLVRRKSA